MHAIICPADGALIHPSDPCFILHIGQFTINSSGVNVPYPVRGWRWNVDSECPAAFLHLHGEEQRRVGHLLHFLLDELRLSGFLEVLRLGNLVHKAHDLAGPVASHVAAG